LAFLFQFFNQFVERGNRNSHLLLFEGLGTQACPAFEKGTEMGLVLEAESVGYLLNGK